MAVEQLYSVLWRRKLVILGTIVLLVAAAVYYTSRQPKTYSATALVRIQQTITNSAMALNAPAGAMFTVGARFSGGVYSLFQDCQIAEVVVCNARLSDSDRTLLEGYFASKYEIR